jgi:hypothetical protein
MCLCFPQPSLAFLVFLIVGLEERDSGQASELVSALEEGYLEDEEIAHEFAPELRHERTGGSSRSA